MRVVVADAMTIFRSGVRTLLARHGGFDVAEASNLDELLAASEEERPDLALIDFELPPYGGLRAVEELALRCSTRSIVWSFSPAPESVLAAIQAGADGYLTKSISPNGLTSSLRGLAIGEAPMPRALTSALVKGVQALGAHTRALEQAARLSAREREVIELIAAGLRNKEVASLLYISEFTVKRHVQNILDKLELSSRFAAAAFYRSALELGAIAPAARTTA
jgi:two-component system, NarL family, nitrate/nitrite response regulator NarL